MHTHKYTIPYIYLTCACALRHNLSSQFRDCIILLATVAGKGHPPLPTAGGSLFNYAHLMCLPRVLSFKRARLIKKLPRTINCGGIGRGR